MNCILEKLATYDLFIVNYILDFTDLGIQLHYDFSMNCFTTHIDFYSSKFLPVSDLFSNQIHFFHTKQQLFLFGIPLTHFSTEIIIKPQKNRLQKKIRLFYINIYHQQQCIPVFSGNHQFQQQILVND